MGRKGTSGPKKWHRGKLIIFFFHISQTCGWRSWQPKNAYEFGQKKKGPPPKTCYLYKNSRKSYPSKTKTLRWWWLYSNQTPQKKLCTTPIQTRKGFVGNLNFYPHKGCKKPPQYICWSSVREGQVGSQDFLSCQLLRRLLTSTVSMKIIWGYQTSTPYNGNKVPLSLLMWFQRRPSRVSRVPLPRGNKVTFVMVSMETTWELELSSSPNWNAPLSSSNEKLLHLRCQRMPSREARLPPPPWNGKLPPCQNAIKANKNRRLR